MKLIDFRNFAPLNDLRSKMGAMLVEFSGDFSFSELDSEILKLLETEGIEIDLGDITFAKDHTILYKGRRVVLYIRDWNAYYGEEESSAPKFHIAECQALRAMYRHGCKERYVVATRDDGLFEVNYYKSSREMRLEVCKKCLEKLRWMNYHRSLSDDDKDEIKMRFTLENFFKAYPKGLLDSKGHYRADLAQDNRYPPNWNKISRKTREERGWKCEECQIYLKDYPAYLDVHHIDRFKPNTRSDNLKVLCIECHAKQPFHSHMKNQRLKEYLQIKPRLK